jgi:23S rRNA (pseudouridine1915-N3)-methyltransferase
MRLEIVAIGRLKAGPERDLAQRYAERIEAGGRALHLSGPMITELPESAARRAEDRKGEESQAITARLGAGFRLVVFDEGGAAIDSPGFARMIGEWRDTGVAGASFVIGGADGLDPALGSRAERVLAFGRMTIPHQIVRVLVLEQLYRATTILAGHPYHRV